MSETPSLNEELVERIDALGPTPLTMTMYRHTSLSRDPLSGAGAARSGGRWNARGIPTVYLARPQSAAIAELRHLADATGMAYASLLRAGRLLHTVEVRDLPVLDLRPAGILEQVGLEHGDLEGDDWSACSAVGHAAWFLELGGVIAPSARADGAVLAAFEDRIGHQLDCTASNRITLDDT